MRQSSQALFLLCLFAGLQVCYSVAGTEIDCVSNGSSCGGCLPATEYEAGTDDIAKCRVKDCSTTATTSDWCESCGGSNLYTNKAADKCISFDCNDASPTYSNTFCLECDGVNNFVNKAATKCGDTDCTTALTADITDAYCANCDEVNMYASKGKTKCGKASCASTLTSNLTDDYCANCDEVNLYASKSKTKCGKASCATALTADLTDDYCANCDETLNFVNTAKTACVSESCSPTTWTDALCLKCSPTMATARKDGENACVDCSAETKTDILCAQCVGTGKVVTWDTKTCGASKCDVAQPKSAAFCTNCDAVNKFFNETTKLCVLNDCSATPAAGAFTDSWCADCQTGSTMAATDKNSCMVEEVVVSSYILSASFVVLAIINLF